MSVRAVRSCRASERAGRLRHPPPCSRRCIDERLQLLRASRSTLIDEDEAVRSREGQQGREEVVVRSAGSAVDDEQRRTLSQRLVVDQHAIRVYEAFLLNEDDSVAGCSRRRLLCSSASGENKCEGRQACDSHAWKFISAGFEYD